MRCDRGTTFATVLVLLCCLGGTAGVVSFMSGHAFVVATATTNPVGIVKVSPTSQTVKADDVNIGCENNGNLFLHTDIVELHNLPPPSGA